MNFSPLGAEVESLLLTFFRVMSGLVESNFVHAQNWIQCSINPGQFEIYMIFARIHKKGTPNYLIIAKNLQSVFNQSIYSNNKSQDLHVPKWIRSDSKKYLCLHDSIGNWEVISVHGVIKHYFFIR